MNKKNDNSMDNNQNKPIEVKEAGKQKNKKSPEEQASGASKKIIKGIIEWIIYVLVFVLIVWGTPKALVKILNTNYPIASVTSSSMWPTLKRGDLIFVKGIHDPSTIKIGDIVVYTHPSASQSAGEAGETSVFTIHRVTELREATLVTKGDANNISDKPVSYEQVIGQLVKIGNWNVRIPKLGLISINLSSRF